jgi:hypothetical protein
MSCRARPGMVIFIDIRLSAAKKTAISYKIWRVARFSFPFPVAI